MPADERSCIKCGRPVDADVSVCEICNRARMATPSASQYHGTIAVAIIAGVAALALGASLVLRGAGPFRGSTVSVEGAPRGRIDVAVEVLNEGTRAGRGTCRCLARDASGRRLGTATITTPSIQAGERLTFAERLPAVEEIPDRVSVDCV